MRVLAACLLGFLGLGALTTMAACSDSTDGSGGAGGASGAAGSAAKAGGSSTAGTAGAPAAECGFQTPACSACLGEKCEDQVGACTGTCQDALIGLAGCACKPGADAEACITTFVEENGDPALKLAECYSLNCEDVCQ
ncbi:MAG TPA: hypothetical protein VJV79_01075 [Polyangiaceae bacterium]|nr:hypothetical protein [Polyangiaceae bacterium]